MSALVDFAALLLNGGSIWVVTPDGRVETYDVDSYVRLTAERLTGCHVVLECAKAHALAAEIRRGG